MYLIPGRNSRILHCFGQLKEEMDFDMIWPKWFLMSFGVI
jgi:hypothetical protein